MGIYENAADRKQAGFTLVELAVVMIIIGLLIGGVLKGQELIANAQITGTASAIKGIDAATTTFRDTYAAMPGDMIGANTRLPDCTAAPCAVAAADGNGLIDDSLIAAAPGAENVGFWAQLGAADLMTGINPDATAAGNAWGANFPSAPINGGFHAAYHPGGALGANNGPSGARRGHYLILTNTPGAAAGADALNALQAARIDRKIDDGAADTGTVFPLNGGTACNAAAVYAESNANTTCDLIIRFQN